jgi:hypothetical protein
MNHWLDQALVGLLLLASGVYAAMALGPRVWRARVLAALGAAAALKPKGGCGGCEDCGANATPASSQAQPSPPPEIRIPVGKIGRRA